MTETNKGYCRWVKASERSPEPKPDMDNNKEYSFHCRCEGRKIILYFWSFNWWGENSNGVIYGISEKVFNNLEWLDESQLPSVDDKFEFVEWINNKNYRKVASEQVLWGIGFENENYTTSELYILFIKYKKGL